MERSAISPGTPHVIHKLRKDTPMSETPSKEQECRQDMLRRLQKFLDMLEGRIDVLHDTTPEKQNMRPGECEQAIDRHIVLTLRLLQMRQQFVQDEHKIDRARLLEEMFAEEGEELIPH
jgi:hypothetical protein